MQSESRARPALRKELACRLVEPLEKAAKVLRGNPSSNVRKDGSQRHRQMCCCSKQKTRCQSLHGRLGRDNNWHLWRIKSLVFCRQAPTAEDERDNVRGW